MKGKYNSVQWSRRKIFFCRITGSKMTNRKCMCKMAVRHKIFVLLFFSPVRCGAISFSCTTCHKLLCYEGKLVSFLRVYFFEAKRKKKLLSLFCTKETMLQEKSDTSNNSHFTVIFSFRPFLCRRESAFLLLLFLGEEVVSSRAGVESMLSCIAPRQNQSW